MKHAITFVVMGLLYLNMEVVARAVRAELVSVLSVVYLSLAGWTSVWMFFIGGLCGFSVGIIHEYFPSLAIYKQCLLGTIVIYAIEFSAGLVFNIFLSLSLWDYSTWPLNILGQITLLYVPVWFLLCPFIIGLYESLKQNDLNGVCSKTIEVYKKLMRGQ